MSQHAFSPISQRLRATGTVLDSLVAARRTRLPELYEAYGNIDPLTLPRSERSFCAPVPRAKTASRRAPVARPSSWSASQLPRPWGQSSRGRILRVSWLAHMLPTLRQSVCSPNPIVSTVASRTLTRCAPKSLSRFCARTSSLIQSRSPRRECTARTPSCSC